MWTSNYMLHLLSILLIEVVLNSECMWCNQPNLEIVLLESVQHVGLVHATLSTRCVVQLSFHKFGNNARINLILETM